MWWFDKNLEHKTNFKCHFKVCLWITVITNYLVNSYYILQKYLLQNYIMYSNQKTGPRWTWNYYESNGLLCFYLKCNLRTLCPSSRSTAYDRIWHTCYSGILSVSKKNPVNYKRLFSFIIINYHQIVLSVLLSYPISTII